MSINLLTTIKSQLSINSYDCNIKSVMSYAVMTDETLKEFDSTTP